MIELTQQQLQILLQIADRAPKTSGEQYAIEQIVSDANAQIAAAQKAEIERASRKDDPFAQPAAEWVCDDERLAADMQKAFEAHGGKLTPANEE